MREQTIIRLISELEKKGFLVTSYLHSNNCFDIAAKKSSQLLLIKVFENIDATRPDEALELKKLSTALRATSIIVGEKTKTAPLSDSLVYERYGINCITFNSFSAFFLSGTYLNTFAARATPNCLSPNFERSITSQ